MRSEGNDAKVADRISTGEAQAQRRLRWVEMSIEQKIESLREAMVLMTGQLEVMGRLAVEAHKVANLHEHGQGGGKFMPIDAGANRIRGLSDLGSDGEFLTRRLRTLLD